MLRTVSLAVVLVQTVVAVEQGPMDCQNEFDVAQTRYEQAIEDARIAAVNARQAKNAGDSDRCRWERGRAMAAANQVPKHWQIMNDLSNSVNCKYAVPSPPKFHGWDYADMGFGYGEAGFILFNPLHCGLSETSLPATE